jgi:hypothetical protein
VHGVGPHFSKRILQTTSGPKAKTRKVRISVTQHFSMSRCHSCCDKSTDTPVGETLLRRGALPTGQAELMSSPNTTRWPAAHTFSLPPTECTNHPHKPTLTRAPGFLSVHVFPWPILQWRGGRFLAFFLSVLIFFSSMIISTSAVSHSPDTHGVMTITVQRDECGHVQAYENKITCVFCVGDLMDYKYMLCEKSLEGTSKRFIFFLPTDPNHPDRPSINPCSLAHICLQRTELQGYGYACKVILVSLYSSISLFFASTKQDHTSKYIMYHVYTI